MSVAETYFYNNQLRSYIVQFAAIFQGIQVQVGSRDGSDPALIYVPVKNASSDRVVAAIKGENTQNKPIRLPIMAFQLASVDMAPERRHGIGQTRRNTYVPTGGLIPNDITVEEQHMPIPYNSSFELTIWASNQDQHYQIMEQILSLFDPILQIQKTDDVFDWTKITTVELMDIRFDENVPSGADRRTIQSTLSFSVPIHLSVPGIKHKKFVENIYMRIGAIGTNVTNSYDIIADLDAQNITYDQVASGTNLPIS